MKAVILAAGEGSRMYPLTQKRPKAMLPAAGKPIVERLAEEMAAAGIREIIVVVGYLGDVIKEYLGDGGRLGVRVKYVYQERADGTAAAMALAQKALSDTFLVACGDSLVSQGDIAKLIKRGGSQIGVKEVEKPERFGVVGLEGDRVVRILEKPHNPTSNLISTGLYVFTPEIFKAINAVPRSLCGEYELTAGVQILIDSGVSVGCCHLDSWLDVSYPWDILTAGEKLMESLESRNKGVVEAGAVINGMVRIGAGSIIRAGSYISGPVIIGRDCDVGPNCYIRASTVVGDGCRIGAGVELKNSVVMNGTNIAHLSYVGDSVVGENCNLGAGTKVANMRLDKGEVIANGIPTGRRKFGVVMGDEAQTGVGVCINPGTVVGGGAWLGPGVLAGGDVAQGARVFRAP